MKYILLFALILVVSFCVCWNAKDIRDTIEYHNQLQANINLVNDYQNKLLEAHNKLVINCNNVSDATKKLVEIAVRNGNITVIDPNDPNIIKPRPTKMQLST